MHQIVGIPPNYAAIKARFPFCDQKGVIFSYGDKIFNPSGVFIQREVVVHEATHGLRQLAYGVEKWWEKYLDDMLFMLNEEIYAHHNEYIAAVKRHGHRDRDLRRISMRLCGPLYGGALTYEQARHAILTGEVK